MKSSNKKSNKFAPIILAVLVALALWYFGFNAHDTVSAQVSPTLSVGFMTPAMDPSETSVSRALKQLESINFDFSIFQDKVFLQLRDLSAPLSNLPVGNDNPFAASK